MFLRGTKSRGPSSPSGIRDHIPPSPPATPRSIATPILSNKFNRNKKILPYLDTTSSGTLHPIPPTPSSPPQIDRFSTRTDYQTYLQIRQKEEVASSNRKCRDVHYEATDENDGGVELLAADVGGYNYYNEQDQQTMDRASQNIEREREKYKKLWSSNQQPTEGVERSCSENNDIDSRMINDSEEKPDFESGIEDPYEAEETLPIESDESPTHHSGIEDQNRKNRQNGAIRKTEMNDIVQPNDPPENQITTPNKELYDLINAICQEDDFTRRKNACGALKVMTTPKGIQKIKIARTKGVLDAIAVVLGQDQEKSIFTRGNGQQNLMARISAYREAKLRIAQALLNLCVNPENRVFIFENTRLVNSMIHVINTDTSEPRLLICACFSYLAKTSDNRLPIAKHSKIIDTLMETISIKANKENEIDIILSSRGSDMSDNPLLFKGLNGDSHHAIDTKQTEGITNKDSYDDPNMPFLNGARVHIFACCLHLVKDKEVVHDLARKENFMESIIEVANRHDSPAHTLCIAMLAHLSRLGENAYRMIFNTKDLLRTLVRATNSNDSECRKYACFTLENLSCEPSCRQEMANSPGLIATVCFCSTNDGFGDQQLASVSTLRNLSKDFSCMIPLSASKDCLLALMQIARMHKKKRVCKDDDNIIEDVNQLSEKKRMMEYFACDAVATICAWMVMEANSKKKRLANLDEDDPEDDSVERPTILRVPGWELWD